MISVWFTQPFTTPSKVAFASYYQYDSFTKSLVRIRLELGRTPRVNSSGVVTDDGSPRIMLDQNRVVGFSGDRSGVLKSKYAPGMKETFGSKLSFQKDGFYFGDGEANEKLVSEIKVFDPNDEATKPAFGEFVYDTTMGASASHTGNALTAEPKLPLGVEVEHLTLLASNAVITGQSRTVFGAGTVNDDATRDDLGKMIVREAERVARTTLGLPDGVKLTERDLRDALEKQAKEMGAAQSRSAEMEIARREIKQVNVDVDQTMIEEGAVPDQKLEALGGKLLSSAASGDFKAMETGAADMSGYLNTAVQQRELANSTTLQDVRAALSNIETSATAMREAQESYQALENVDSVEGYESDIGLDPNVGSESMTKTIK